MSDTFFVILFCFLIIIFRPIFPESLFRIPYRVSHKVKPVHNGLTQDDIDEMVRAIRSRMRCSIFRGLNRSRLTTILSIVECDSESGICKIGGQVRKVVTTGVVLGPLAGGGDRYTLEKDENGWKVIGKGIWVS